MRQDVAIKQRTVEIIEARLLSRQIRLLQEIEARIVVDGGVGFNGQPQTVLRKGVARPPGGWYRQRP